MGNTILFVLKFLAAGVAAHLVFCRLSKCGKFMVNGLLIGAVLTGTACLWRLKTGSTCLLALYLLLSAWLVYLMFFINLMNSLTLKMLERLAGEPGGTLSAAEFNAIFNEEAGLKARLADMNANGFVKIKDERIFITGKAGRLLHIIYLLRKTLSIGVAGQPAPKN